MNPKELFFKDKTECAEPFTHIMEDISDPALKEIDELYGAADVLSIQNARKYRRVLLALSFAGTLLTLAFLLYDEAELHWLIIACGVMILCLFLIHRIADRLDSHRRYLEYRVLAEGLRVQFFLYMAGITTKVCDMLPWSVRKGIPWICEVLKDIPEPETGIKQPILDCWVIDQKNYHRSALKKAESKLVRDGRTATVVLMITICAYVAALIFELIISRNPTLTSNPNLIRAILKILLGTMSAITLFTGSYYGKMSLANVIDDHKRMIALYETAEEEIVKHGETEEMLLFLAREYLNENSTWYAYQNKNKPDIVI